MWRWLVPLLLLTAAVMAYLILGRSASQAAASPPSPSMPAASESSAPAPKLPLPPIPSTVDTTAFIDAPFIEIGKLAGIYGRKHGYVICDDLLADTRHVGLNLTYDNSGQIESVLASYGYRSYTDHGLTYWCGSSDPFLGAELVLVSTTGTDARGRQLGPIVQLSYMGRTGLYPLATLLSVNDLAVEYTGCAYRLYRRNGRMVRILTDGDCLARLAAPPVTIASTAAEAKTAGTSALPSAPVAH